MNYAKHNEELKHTLTQIQGVKVGMPQSLVEQGGITLFLKPDTALTRPDWPFFVPDWSEQIEYETELVVRINRLGKSIPERFAHRYYDEITLGLDFTARDIQRQLSQKGLPWEIAKGFDGAAYCGQKWLRLSEMSGKNV
jgi:2-keto-4-pentenoate hydratase/2-oxohepta-3-ene-1,7-dioic acid hydratase in catechol pathway